MRRRAAPLALACLLALPACEKLDSFDTKGDAAYCGPIIDAQFVRTVESGFGHEARMRLELDTAHLNSAPGWITTSDTGCPGDSPMFDDDAIRVQPEVKHDPLSAMTFEDGQVQNIVGWVNARCRGSVLVIVSLLKTDRVDVRLLEPKDQVPTGNDVFSVFSLTRNETGCGF
jgi:hypothetical protein